MSFLKTMAQLLFTTISLMAFSLPGSAQELITGLTNEAISITSDFTGTELVVFGTVNNMEELITTGENVTIGHFDVVVVIEGPKEPGIVRKKERAVGIWINRDSVSYENIPSSYLMMSSKTLDEGGLGETLAALEIGLNHVSFGDIKDLSTQDRPEEFRKAVVRLKMENNLYNESTGVRFLGDNLFRAQFDIPALIPVGIHQVRSYLLLDNRLVSSASHSINIRKIGFEQVMFDFATDYGFIYGFFCVVLAMFTGWLSSVIFRRD